MKRLTLGLGILLLLSSFSLSSCRYGTLPVRPTVLPSAPAGTLVGASTFTPKPVFNATSSAEIFPSTPVPDPSPTPDPRFWTKELKGAIAAALNRETLAEQVFAGRNLPAYSMVPPTDRYAGEPFRERYAERNLDLARELLAGAGYSAERQFQFDLWYPKGENDSELARAMQVIQSQLEETGMIQVVLRELDWKEYEQRYRSGELPVFLLSWSPDFIDTDTWLSPFAECSRSPAFGVFYCNPEMDGLLARAAAEADPSQRGVLYRQIGAIYAAEAPTIPLYWEPDFIAFRNGVQGVNIGPTLEFNYNQLSFADGYLPASGQNDTLIIGTTDGIYSLDSGDAYRIHDWEIIKNTGAALLQYSPETRELVSGSAELPEISPDGLTYTFKLKPGIRFADGSPLLALDYVYAFQRLTSLNGDVAGLVTQYVAGVTAPDDETVVFTLKKPAVFFPSLAATAAFVPVNPAEFPLDRLNRLPQELNGIGPYRLAAYTPSEELMLEANPNYFGEDQPLIPNVRIRYFSDPTILSSALERGEIDIAWRSLGAVEAARLAGIADSAALTVEKVDALTLYFLVFNHTFQ